MVLENEYKVTTLQYFIGEDYRYYSGKKKYKLKEVSESGIFKFECGHWCTDNVFWDLVRCSTGKQNYLDNQTELELK